MDYNHESAESSCMRYFEKVRSIVERTCKPVNEVNAKLRCDIKKIAGVYKPLKTRAEKTYVKNTTADNIQIEPPKTKLTVEHKHIIRAGYSAGKPRKQIANELGLTLLQVSGYAARTKLVGKIRSGMLIDDHDQIALEAAELRLKGMSWRKIVETNNNYFPSDRHLRLITVARFPHVASLKR
jgi:hypothetical protein